MSALDAFQDAATAYLLGCGWVQVHHNDLWPVVTDGRANEHGMLRWLPLPGAIREQLASEVGLEPAAEAYLRASGWRKSDHVHSPRAVVFRMKIRRFQRYDGQTGELIRRTLVDAVVDQMKLDILARHVQSAAE